MIDNVESILVARLELILELTEKLNGAWSTGSILAMEMRTIIAFVSILLAQARSVKHVSIYNRDINYDI